MNKLLFASATVFFTATAACSGGTDADAEASEAEIAAAGAAPVTLACAASDGTDSRLDVSISRDDRTVSVAVDGAVVARTSPHQGMWSTSSFDFTVRRTTDGADTYEGNVDSVTTEVLRITSVDAVRLAFAGDRTSGAATLTTIEVARTKTAETAPQPQLRALDAFKGARCVVTGLAPEL